MKRTILALALVATTFGAFAQNTTPAAKTATTETAKVKHHKKAAKKAAKAEAKPVEAKKTGK
jgi:acyl-coenzyme A thioesterase PaaI-like protein